MTDSPESATRIDDRHGHITIGLRLLWQGQWEPLEARGWNDVGFNFFHSREISQPALQLRRQLLTFEGRIVWSATNASDEVLASMLLNALIFHQARKLQADATLQQRLLRLIRVSGMLPQKKAVLASLGHTISDADIANRIARRKERPLYHYGVQVDSEVWRSTVNKAVALSAAVESLEKWADSLAGP